jgi:hypothetical protein
MRFTAGLGRFAAALAAPGLVPEDSAREPVALNPCRSWHGGTGPGRSWLLAPVVAAGAPLELRHQHESELLAALPALEMPTCTNVHEGTVVRWDLPSRPGADARKVFDGNSVSVSWARARRLTAEPDADAARVN